MTKQSRVAVNLELLREKNVAKRRQVTKLQVENAYIQGYLDGALGRPPREEQEDDA